ncbi:hypothetical protein LWC35_30215 [Pseudonocardia kujensis]|uniref:hypothetical protein n=1 Tax=Pseudonocardia kujensis TaxID=1128675 RepID=UPI001E603CD4|nr:hypothetical protein [Pseudonocardia kujensis]MCE0767149.1 hypothetical protein [Pseudonocardia kujensis]
MGEAGALDPDLWPVDWPEHGPGEDPEGGVIVGSGRPPADARARNRRVHGAGRPVRPGRVPASGTAGESAAERLATARGLLRRMEDRSAAAVRPAPTPSDDGRVLPVAAPLVPLLPGGGLRRGSTVSVSTGPGSTSLLFGLLAEASAEGAWAGVVGAPGLGAVAAAEAGIRLERLALVPRPGADLVAVTAALLDGLDLVVVAGAERAGVRGGDRQRLAARARQRGAVLLALGAWPGADLALDCTQVEWRGVARGAGRLRSRCAVVRSSGRGTGASGRETELLLPGPAGAVAPREEIRRAATVDEPAEVPVSRAAVS